MRSQVDKEGNSFNLGDGKEKDSFVEDEDAYKDGEDDAKAKEPEEKPVPMSYIGHTLEFPRKDNVYKKKEALPFDEAHSLVWKRAFRNDWKENLKHWLVYMIAGAMIGITAFGMDKLEELLVNSNRRLL